MSATSPRCHRCKVRPGKAQPSDGDASMLFVAAHGMADETGADAVHLCGSCTRTLERMSRRAAGERMRGRLAP